MPGSEYIQPVAGEPSLGTFHARITEVAAFVPANPGVGGWSAAFSISAFIPAGAKAVYGKLIVRSDVAGEWGQIAGIAGNTYPPYLEQYCPVAAQYTEVAGIVRIDSNLRVYYNCLSANMNYIGFVIQGYWI